MQQSYRHHDIEWCYRTSQFSSYRLALQPSFKIILKGHWHSVERMFVSFPILYYYFQVYNSLRHYVTTSKYRSSTGAVFSVRISVLYNIALKKNMLSSEYCISIYYYSSKRRRFSRLHLVYNDVYDDDDAIEHLLDYNKLVTNNMQHMLGIQWRLYLYLFLILILSKCSAKKIRMLHYMIERIIFAKIYS